MAAAFHLGVMQIYVLLQARNVLVAIRLRANRLSDCKKASQLVKTADLKATLLLHGD
jgi:hypothetical protein